MPEALEDVFQAGRYVYMEDLRIIASRKPKDALVVPPPLQLQPIHIPLRLSSWQQYLQGHPDSEFVTFLLEGISSGFRIGFNYGSHQCRAAKRNMQSAIQNPQVVDQYLTKECEKGRIIGPLEKGSLSLHINRFGVIPKPHQPGKWRLIVDMSHPDKASVNEGIDPSLCSLSYATIDDAVTMILKKGGGAQFAKLDLESAYRMVPVHPEDRQLLGMEWKGQWYVDAALPFGLRSAPKVFTALADGWSPVDHV